MSPDHRMNIFTYTKALCPTCRQLVNSRIVEMEGKVYLEKLCCSDGVTRALICSDVDWYRESASYTKPSQRPRATLEKEFQGCPDSCGLCPEHQQHTCLPVIEITSTCNLKCPICLKNSKRHYALSVAEYKNILCALQEYEENLHVINLSGGEPTLHPFFRDFIEVSNRKGIMQTTVSTNGLRLLKDKDLRKFFIDTGTVVALQFDGFSPETYRFLRGRDLSRQKLELIRVCEDEGIKFSLVTTVLRGVNDGEIASIVDFFFGSRAMSIMFQPAAFTGDAFPLADERLRMTIPDVVQEIEKSPHVQKGDFNPLPCSHASCFALSYYLTVERNRFLSLKEFIGREDYLNIISNRTLPGLDTEGYSLIRDRIYEFWSAEDSLRDNEAVMLKLRNIIKALNESDFSPKRAFTLGSESMKAIFIHQFMDLYTFDLGRLVKCCNHYPQADGRLMPICAQNIFSQ